MIVTYDRQNIFIIQATGLKKIDQFGSLKKSLTSLWFSTFLKLLILNNQYSVNSMAFYHWFVCPFLAIVLSTTYFANRVLDHLVNLSLGDKTFSIMTFSIMTFTLMTFSIITFSIITFSIITFRKKKFVTNDIQYNDTQHTSIEFCYAECRNSECCTCLNVMLSVVMLSVICWESLC